MPKANEAKATEEKPVTEKKAGGFQPKVKRVLTLPHMKLKLNETVYIRIESEPEKKTFTRNGNEETLEAMQVTDLETGEMKELAMLTVLESRLREFFPDGIAGVCVALTQVKKEGKDYFNFNLTEIEDPDKS